MSADGEFAFAGVRSSFANRGLLAAKILREGGFFDAPMNTGFLERLQRGGLGVCQSGLGATFGKRPTTAAASLNQKKLDLLVAYVVADRRDLLRLTQLTQA